MNILVGITVGMVACCGQLSSRRQETLLYITVSILTLNIVNIIITEWGFYSEDLPKMFQKHRYHTLVEYASYATRISAVAVILVSFLDSQLAFCSMQTAAAGAKKNLLRGSHEQVSDIEYIIPRSKSSSKPQVLNAYSQSWVFETENGKTESPYLKLQQDGTPERNSEVDNGKAGNDTTYLIDNPMVHIEEASDDSNSNSDRKLCYMKSFSRSASPVILSASSSQISLNHNPIPIYECLEKFNQSEAFRTRLNSALSSKEEPQYQIPQVMARNSDVVSPQVERVQYASLMKELQKVIVCKKDPNSGSPQSDVTQINSKSSSRQDSSAKNSDAEFSKELEAALQLIQDLESPNTIETPSETKSEKDAKSLVVWNTNSRSDSERTLSAVGSLAEINTDETYKSSANGKSARIVVQYSESQSTSGYSSPTHNQNAHNNWSTTSSLNGSNHDMGGRPLSCSIHNSNNSAVISLYQTNILTKVKGSKSVTLVNITDDIPTSINIPDIGDNKSETDISLQTVTNINVNGWNVKSLLRKKKQKPRLCPELEGAIIKSESLAYLTELELLARHQRNKNIHRQIEQRVQQQLGTPWTDND
ncbi:PREDICTED: uncharacterized protein LOC108560408 isoform X2 [Nicrophorus vespilloides]|uniref:Uncharacterized protein LOC108560408 isoform X2 n=1 Tax=Nicrophorus vespilloides TaxID=110193 RepID=A0ABM1MFS4_NICVS|nr:PREDICTED: uncharacterized protein LOC108560408 isoform X2 [Nicrophorus vespilloides]